MATLTDIATWAVGQIGRSDLQTTAVTMAKDFYLTLCGKVPFEALRERSANLPVVAGTDWYSFATLTPAVAGLISVSMAFSPSEFRRLKRGNERKFEALRGVAAGKPHSYARWKGGIEFFPTPSSADYTYRLRYWTYPTIDANVGNTVVAYPQEWVELHQWETLYRLYIRTDQHEKAMALVQPAMMPRQFSPKKTTMHEVGIIPRLWNDLLRTIDMREGVDEDFSVNPTDMGSYTWR